MKKTLLLLVCVIIIISGINLSACTKSDDIRTLYEMEIDFDVKEMKATVSQYVTFTNNTENTLETLAFHLYPDAFNSEAETLPVTDRLISEAYYNGVSYGDIDILRVEENDKSLTYSEAAEMLNVSIPKLLPGKDIKVFLRYSLTLPNVNHRFGYNETSINLANFYPQVAVYESNEFRNDKYYSIGDPFYSETADYNIKLKIDKDYIVASTGKSSAEILNIDSKTINLEAENVRDFALVMSDDYKVLSNTVNGVNVNYFYCEDSAPETSLNAACGAIEVFSDIIGEYPYPTFNVAETGFIYGGMEYPELVMISSELTEDRAEVIVHETAHQWFYGLIGNDSINASWMDEGLTEFVTALYFKEIGQQNIMSEKINAAFNSYVLYNDVASTPSMQVNTCMNRGLGEFKTEYEYVTMTYTKGILMFNTIYEIIGRDEFVKVMKKYYKEYVYEIAEEQQLIDAFNSRDKAVDKVFDAWLNGKVILLSIREA